MIDEIFPDDVVLRVDEVGTAEVRHLIANDLGPAGICSLTLADRSVVQVDYAEPDRLISVEPGPDPDVLAALVGEARAEAVLSTRSLGDNSALRLPGSGRRDVGRRTSQPRQTQAAVHLGRVAALMSIHHDADELPLVRAVAGFESVARSADPLIAPILNREEATTIVDQAIALATSADDDVFRFNARHPKLAMEVARLVDEARHAIGRTDALESGNPLRRLERLDDRRRARPSDDELMMQQRRFAAAPPASPMRPFPRSSRDEFAFSRVFAEPVGPKLAIAPRGRLTITWKHQPDGDWARVLRAGSQVLLALVPIVAENSQWSAQAIIPPELGVDDLEVDTSDRPIDTDPPASRLERVRAAVDLGRQAANVAVSRRRGHESAELWRRCADAWRELGDDRRADRALAYAAGRLEVSRRSTLADEVREAVDAP